MTTLSDLHPGEVFRLTADPCPPDLPGRLACPVLRFRYRGRSAKWPWFHLARVVGCPDNEVRFSEEFRPVHVAREVTRWN